MLAIYKRELKSCFQSMTGPVFVAFLIAFTGIYSYQKNNNISDKINNSFGLVAYAANTGEIIKPQDNILVFEEGGGYDSTIGFFTGCLFKITGENIEKVKISLDADGGIYRSKMFTEEDISLEEIEAMWNDEDIGIAGAKVCQNEKTKDSDPGRFHKCGGYEDGCHDSKGIPGRNSGHNKDHYRAESLFC